MSDLIDRQAVINKINERQRKLVYCFGFENDLVKIMNIAKSIIIAIPSAQPEDVARDIATIIENEKDMRVMLSQQWIPCSERLPSEDGEYLVTRYAGYLPKKIIIDIAIYCRIRREWQKAYPVIAWMPLPEPYREDIE